MLTNIHSIITDNDSKDCPICFNETNGLKMTFHTYLKYIDIWHNKKSPYIPLVKCIKCNNYICNRCLIYCDKCPFNCHNINEQSTTTKTNDVYKKFAIFREYEYSPWWNTTLWLFQAIYEYHKDPKDGLLIPCEHEDLQISLQETQDLFNQVVFNIQDQIISGFIKLPFMAEPMNIKYPVILIIQKEQLYEVRDPQQVYEEMIKQFKSDITEFFEQITCQIGEFRNDWPLSHDCPDMEVDLTKSIAQLGYIDYILRVLKHCLLPNCTVASSYMINGAYNEMYLFISLEKGLVGEYVIWSLVSDDTGTEANMKVATKQEFIDFFEGCGPQEQTQ